MGFSEEFVQNATAEVTSRSMQDDYNYIQKVLKQALVNAARIAPYFDPKDAVIYLQGCYACKTNTKFQSKIEVIVELTKTREYDYESMTNADMKMRDNFFIDFEHYFDVKHFKDVLADALTQTLRINVNMGTTTIMIPAFGTLQHAIDVFP